MELSTSKWRVVLCGLCGAPLATKGERNLVTLCPHYRAEEPENHLLVYNTYMTAILFRLFWALTVSSVVAYVVYLVIGTTIQAEADEYTKRIVARDVIDRGAHNLSGMVFVPTGCHELSVRAEELPDKIQHIVFSTWETPYAECAREPVPRAFTVVVFEANADVRFIATMDNEPLSFVVIPVSSKRLENDR